MAYLPGDYGARAIADVLAETSTPQAVCPSPGHAILSAPHARLQAHRTHRKRIQPQYTFGFGLSYSPVETTSLEILTGATATFRDTVTVEVTLQNTGDRSTTETVIVYSQDRVASITPSVNELAAYKQVVVPAGATSNITLDVHIEDLGFIGLDNTYIVEPGSFGLRVKDKTVEFELTTP